MVVLKFIFFLMRASVRNKTAMKMLTVRTSQDPTSARAEMDFMEMEKFALVTIQKLKIVLSLIPLNS